MNGKLKDWSFSRTGESVLTITTRESCKKLWDALGDQEITFSIKRRVIPRSLNANNYAWSLIEKLAVAVKSDKDSVYEEMLRCYGTGETYTDEAGNECKVLFSLREGVPPALAPSTGSTIKARCRCGSLPAGVWAQSGLMFCCRLTYSAMWWMRRLTARSASARVSAMNIGLTRRHVDRSAT